MTQVKEKTAVERLKDDHEYYGEFGRQYLSNSDIKVLRENPKEFGIKREDNKAFAEGRYFHQSMLEPDKAEQTLSIGVASRNTKAYKEMLAAENKTIILLEKEIEQIDWLVSEMKSNISMFDLIYAEGNKFEVPQVGKIMGHWFKGKADIVTNKCLIDLKTTSNIHDFKYSARKYGYDTQCYIYQQLFGKPLIFLAIDKNTGLMGKYIPSDEFIDFGRQKVQEGINIYETFFSDNAETDIQDFIIEETL